MDRDSIPTEVGKRAPHCHSCVLSLHFWSTRPNPVLCAQAKKGTQTHLEDRQGRQDPRAGSFAALPVAEGLRKSIPGISAGHTRAFSLLKNFLL